ncbi:MAG: hypothetical protein R3321_12840 [Nitrososphaeraceae archaeon]|nr:hypothetical protein [Nitrososphaeraceae archaeon]
MTKINNNNIHSEFYRDNLCCCCQNIHEEIKSTQKAIAHLRRDISEIFSDPSMRKERMENDL